LAIIRCIKIGGRIATLLYTVVTRVDACSCYNIDLSLLRLLQGDSVEGSHELIFTNDAIIYR
jgi:hypothetical protein